MCREHTQHAKLLQGPSKKRFVNVDTCVQQTCLVIFHFDTKQSTKQQTEWLKYYIEEIPNCKEQKQG